jgi:hypothetical protein
MGAPDLLLTLRQRGLTLLAYGSNLVVQPKSALTEELRSLIRRHKPALLALIQPRATPEEEAELRHLVSLVATFHAFTVKEREEALEIALSDPAQALRCYRALAAEHSLS